MTSVNNSQTNEDSVKPPVRQPSGSKLAQSPYWERAAVMLLAGKGHMAVARYLNGVNFHVNMYTIRMFEQNYVLKLQEQVRKTLIEKGKAEEAAVNSAVVQQAIHSRISYVESLNTLIFETEKQLAKLDTASPFALSSQQMDVKGRYLDRIRYYREKLEHARIDSEVEIERRKAIELVASIALEYMKEKPEYVDEFIKRVEQVADRTVTNV